MNNSSRPDTPLEENVNPNDDGFVLGTAGRDEDPNATTDGNRRPESGEVMTPDDTRGLPGYPGAEENAPSRKPGDAAKDDAASAQDNEGAD